MTDIVTATTRDWGQVDIAYSPDDGGWYAQRWSDDHTTEAIYSSAEDCLQALTADCKWRN